MLFFFLFFFRLSDRIVSFTKDMSKYYSHETVSLEPLQDGLSPNLLFSSVQLPGVWGSQVLLGKKKKKCICCHQNNQIQTENVMVYCMLGDASGNSVLNKCFVSNLLMSMKLQFGQKPTWLLLSLYEHARGKYKNERSKILSSAVGNETDCFVRMWLNPFV